MKCLASELWQKNELEILKKFVLAEAFKKNVPENCPDLSELPTESSLMIALQKSFRGGDDYPKDSNLTLT